MKHKNPETLDPEKMYQVWATSVSLWEPGGFMHGYSIDNAVDGKPLLMPYPVDVPFSWLEASKLAARARKLGYTVTIYAEVT